MFFPLYGLQSKFHWLWGNKNNKSSITFYSHKYSLSLSIKYRKLFRQWLGSVIKCRENGGKVRVFVDNETWRTMYKVIAFNASTLGSSAAEISADEERSMLGVRAAVVGRNWFSRCTSGAAFAPGNCIVRAHTIFINLRSFSFANCDTLGPGTRPFPFPAKDRRFSSIRGELSEFSFFFFREELYFLIGFPKRRVCTSTKSRGSRNSRLFNYSLVYSITRPELAIIFWMTLAWGNECLNLWIGGIGEKEVLGVDIRWLE